MDDWTMFENTVLYSPKTGLMMEWGGMDMDDEYIFSMERKMNKALKAMRELEGGAIANPDEDRMVGHYWLRAPQLAPTRELRDEIEACLAHIKSFVADVHAGKICGQNGGKFKNALVGGIGGSSLGPLFVSKALGAPGDAMKLRFLDNTDPAGMDAIFHEVEDELDETLTIIISKSGGTIETRNCMVEAKNFYEAHGLSFAKHAVTVTGLNSKLDKVAVSEGWIDRFPMWDWVGGRTSVMSAVGLLPLALQGIDIDSFLRGAAECDELSREQNILENPAAVMAMAWYKMSGGKGGVTQVVLPYKDSLDLLAKYLQQLVMESLGKELDLDGQKVNQGLAVMGNKGTSDQHSYVQQLVGGPANIFVVFVQVLKDRDGASCEVGEGSTSGDYLNAFMLGTKKNLEDHGKKTMTVTVPCVSAYNVGQLIAIWERAVGIYAELININAYHQPAVEYGKKCAGVLIELKNRAKDLLIKTQKPMTARELADALSADPRDVFRLMLHLAANDPAVTVSIDNETVTDSTFAAK